MMLKFLSFSSRLLTSSKDDAAADSVILHHQDAPSYFQNIIMQIAALII
jgi:hypothetical protein